MADADGVVYGTAMRSSNRNFYILNMNDYSGVGYFNKDGNFIIEHYDSKTDTSSD